MKTAAIRPSTTRRSSFSILIGVLILLVAVLAVPLYSARSGSAGAPSKGDSAKRTDVRGRGIFANLNSDASATLNLAMPTPTPQETMDTFAQDCFTPKSAFAYGETVCAKTDNVDLGFPGGRWVHWLRENLSIAHGSSTTTLITTNPQFFSFVPDAAGTWKVTIAETGDDSQTPAVFTVSQPPIVTYASNCTTPQTLFTLGDIVCAKSTGVDPTFNRRFAWVDPAGNVRATSPVGSDPDTDSFTLPTAETEVIGTFVVDNRGVWKANIISSRGTVIASAPFQVQGTALRADLSVGKSFAGENTVDAGNNFVYTIAVTNFGPNPAQNVVITDPASPDTSVVNATFSSSNQVSGPAFSCTGSAPVVCKRGTTGSPLFLNPGETAVIELTYTASGATGSTITNTINVSSDTTDLNETDNTFIASEVIIGTGGGTPPTCSLECPNDMTVAATGPSGANVTFGTPDTFGTCGTVSYNHPSGSLFAIGTTTVTASSTIGSGSCTFHVTVIDAPNPTITCPANQTVAAASGEIETTVSVGSPTGVSPVGAMVSGRRDDDRPLSDQYPVGDTLITWQAKDEFDRIAQCVQTIIVTSPDAPTISCPSDKTFTASSGCTFTATEAQIGTPTTTGPGVTVTSERSDGLALTDPFPAGVTFIEWTATNAVGQASCTQKITVNATDTQAPVLSVPPNISVTTSTCSALLDDELGVATATDNCTASVNIVRTGVPRIPCPIPGDPGRTCESFVFPTGTTIIVYTATDAAGNTATGTQTVTVTESPGVPPTIALNGPNPQVVECHTSYTELGATATDNCSGTFAATPSGSVNVNVPGDYTITYNASDASGNAATPVTRTVHVQDTTAPVITLNSFAPSMWPPNHKYSTFQLTQFVTGASDSCNTSLGISSVVIEKVTSDEVENANSGDGNTLNDIVIAADCKSVQLRSERDGGADGRVYTITFKVTDASGNVGRATAKVVVPKNTGQTPVDSGVHYTVNGTCP